MAESVFTNAKVTINGVDLSDHVRSVTLRYEAEMQDKSAMGDTTRERLPGLKDWSMEFEFNQDYAASEVDATIFSLVGAAGVAVAVVPVNTTVSATNPEYSGTALCDNYNPGSGKHGDIHLATASFKGSGTLTRGTGA